MATIPFWCDADNFRKIIQTAHIHDWSHQQNGHNVHNPFNRPAVNNGNIATVSVVAPALIDYPHPRRPPPFLLMRTDDGYIIIMVA